MFSPTKLFIAILGLLILSACTVAKLEARLEANPQCKDVVNPKTGSVMPCPGTDKSFYRSIGLEPQKASPSIASASVLEATTGLIPNTDSAMKASAAASSTAPLAPPSDCKPQIHKKTGGMLPCPIPD